MNADEDAVWIAVDLLGPSDKIVVLAVVLLIRVQRVVLARHRCSDPEEFGQRAQLEPDGEIDIALPYAVKGHRSAVDAAVAGIDHKVRL